MRIPTGVQTVTITASRKSLIQYQCHKCGKKNIYEYELKKQASGSYHAFQTDHSKQNVENGAKEKATKLLDEQDAELFSAINTEHRYEAIDRKIKCPHCGEVQAWSKIPCPWKKTKLFWLWVVILAFLIIDAVVATVTVPSAGLILVAPTLILALLPVFRKRKRKKRLAEMESVSASPPVYYNRQNLHELIAASEETHTNASGSNEAEA